MIVCRHTYVRVAPQAPSGSAAQINMKNISSGSVVRYQCTSYMDERGPLLFKSEEATRAASVAHSLKTAVGVLITSQWASIG